MSAKPGARAKLREAARSVSTICSLSMVVEFAAVGGGNLHGIQSFARGRVRMGWNTLGVGRGQILTNTEHMRMINGIPLEALVTQLLRNPYLLGVVALGEGGERAAPTPHPSVPGAKPASGEEAGTQNPQVILWQTDKSLAPARWLLMEFADQGRLIVSRPNPPGLLFMGR